MATAVAASVFATAFFCGCEEDTSGPVRAPSCWQTVFKDDFNSTELDQNWSLQEGTTDNYVLDGEKIGMNDTNENEDGPMLVYDLPVLADTLRMTLEISTTSMSGEVEAIFIVRGDLNNENGYIFNISNDGISIVRLISGVGDMLEMDETYTMGSNSTNFIECLYTSGELTFNVRNKDGLLLHSISYTDPSPLTDGGVGIMGEIDDSEGEYFYVDNFLLEKCE
jgi:hypothetical protein